MVQKSKLTVNDFVITSKGNYGKVVSIGLSTAKVKIGYKIHEIELYNIHNVTEGTHVRVDYTELDTGKDCDTMLFLRHNDVLYDPVNPRYFIDKVTDLVIKKVQKNVIIVKISIP